MAHSTKTQAILEKAKGMTNPIVIIDIHGHQWRYKIKGGGGNGSISLKAMDGGSLTCIYPEHIHTWKCDEESETFVLYHQT